MNARPPHKDPGQYDPMLYARTHRGNPGDCAFYRDQCADAATVLELGCGFGRLIPSLATPATQYVGIDVSRGLLNLARLQLPDGPHRLVQADMARFAFASRFDRILLPYSGLYCLNGRTEAGTCLKLAEKHLADDGKLILDVYHPDPFHNDSRPEDMADDHDEWVEAVSYAGQQVDIHERSHWNREDQALSVSYRYNFEDGSERWGHIVHRYLLHAQLRSLLRDANLHIQSLAGDFAGGAFTDDGEHTVIVARRM